jgi:hypothetical protein
MESAIPDPLTNMHLLKGRRRNVLNLSMTRTANSICHRRASAFVPKTTTTTSFPKQTMMKVMKRKMTRKK